MKRHCFTMWVSAMLLSAPCTRAVRADLYDLAWTRIADLPGSQYNATASVVDGLVYLVGGNNPGVTNKMQIYNPATNSWSDGPSMPTARYHPDSEVIQGAGHKEIYVVGGYSGSVGLSTVERYVPSLGWETVASVAGPRGLGIMTSVVNNNLYAIGGHSNWDDYYATNEVYDRNSNTWVARTPAPFPLHAGSETVWDDKIYIFGGAGTVASYKTLIYDPSNDTWAYGADVPRDRSFDDAVTFGDYSYLIGGGSPIIDVYDHVHNSWSTVSNYPGTNIGSSAVAQYSDLVYVLGGYQMPMECWVGQVVPVPGAAVLGAIGLGFSGLLGRRKMSQGQVS